MNQEIPKIPIEDFFRNPEKSSFQISPDGSYFSFMAPYKNRMNIFIQKVDASEAQRITSVEERDIAGYTWANDNRLLFLKDVGGDENYALYGVDRDGKNELALTEFEGVQTHLIDDLEEQEEHILVGLNKRDARVHDPYRLNIKTGELELLAENPGNISSWMCDHNGQLRVAIATDGVNSSLLFRNNEEDEFEVILTTNFKESMSPQFFTFDNQKLYSISNLGRDKAAAVIFDPESKKEELLFEHHEVDVASITFSKKNKSLTYYSYITDRSHKEFVDKEVEIWFVKLEKRMEGYTIGIADSNKAEDQFIIRSYSDKSRGAYYFYDLKSDKLKLLVEISPWIKEAEMAEMRSVRFKSRDGLSLNGYLSLPLNSKNKKIPIVINPHGGPWARDYWGFNSEVQFLVNRGYGVLQINFRGSTGYGREFLEASFKQWGQKMQEDLADGVQWLIDDGIADQNRVGIYGGSYGGYATLAGLAFHSNIYKCGVDYVGVSNLFTFIETIPPYWENYLEMLYEMVGHPEKDKEMLHKYSPALNAEKIKAPLLIAQGANDPRVKKSESDQMVEAMRKKGVDVEYLVKDNEGHGFSNEENRFEFYRTMERFFSKHL